MSCISGIFRRSIKQIASRKKTLLEKLNPQGAASRDSLTLEENKARKAEYARLKKLKPPKMGLPEHVMCQLRDAEAKMLRTGDKIPYGDKVRLKNFGQVDSRSIEEGGVFRGAMPMSGEEYEKLAKVYNVKHIIDLRGFETTDRALIEDFAAGWSKFHGMEHHHIPMGSNEEPSSEGLAEIFKILDQALENGEGVYIHCKHGIDRTGSVFAAIEEHLGVGKDAYARMKGHGYNLQHQRSKPAQKAFVTGKDFSSKVRAAEELQRANQYREQSILTPERHASVKRHLSEGSLTEARERLWDAHQKSMAGSFSAAPFSFDLAGEISTALRQKKVLSNDDIIKTEPWLSFPEKSAKRQSSERRSTTRRRSIQSSLAPPNHLLSASTGSSPSIPWTPPQTGSLEDDVKAWMDSHQID